MIQKREKKLLTLSTMEKMPLLTMEKMPLLNPTSKVADIKE